MSEPKSNRRIVAFIEARMTSSRLPGKGMKLCLGRPLLDLMIERVRRVRSLDSIVLATTVNAADEPLVELAERLGIACYRGSEYDVVGRIEGAVKETQADVLVRLTGDCPLVDPSLVEQHVRLFVANQLDYVTNTLIRSFPDGLDVQIASREAFIASLELCRTPLDREYLFHTISQNTDKFRVLNILAPAELCWPSWRWTLDTEADYQFICRIYELLYPTNPTFCSQDIARTLLKRPELLE